MEMMNRPGQGRPDGHRRHAQRGQPGRVRPPAGPGAGRPGGVLRAARRRACSTSRRPDWAEVFQAFDAEPDRDWAGDFQRLALPRRVRGGRAVRPAARAGPGPVSGPAAPAAHPGHPWRSSPRCAGGTWRSSPPTAAYLVVLAMLPIVLGALILAGPDRAGGAGRAPGTTGDAESLLLILIICACLVGAANSVRELVKERSIYERERAAGLSSGAYLFSKLIVLGVISGVQAVLLVLLGLVGRQMPGPRRAADVLAAGWRSSWPSCCSRSRRWPWACWSRPS